MRGSLTTHTLVGALNIDEKWVDDINRLLKQLSPASPAISLETINILFNQSNLTSILIIDEHRDVVIGMATVVFIEKTLMHPNGIAQVEDFVVDSAYRGRGLGRQIMGYIKAIARNRRVEMIRLTSNPNNRNWHRAIELYKKADFEEKNNYYALKIDYRA